MLSVIHHRQKPLDSNGNRSSFRNVVFFRIPEDEKSPETGNPEYTVLFNNGDQSQHVL
jgi:hypothetical protein